MLSNNIRNLLPPLSTSHSAAHLFFSCNRSYAVLHRLSLTSPVSLDEAMAEILGIVAGGVGLVDVGMKLLVKLRALARTWDKASDEILSLHNEVSDLSTLLPFTKSACEESVHHVDLDGKFSDLLNQHLHGVKCLLDQISRDLGTLEIHQLESPKRRKWKWLRVKSSLLARRDQVNSVRIKLWEFLQVYQLSGGSRIQVELASMQLNLREYATTTSEGLRSMHDRIDSFDRQLEHFLKSASQNHHDSSPEAREKLSEIVEESKQYGYLSPPAYHGAPRHGHHDTFSIWAAYRHRTCSTACCARAMQPHPNQESVEPLAQLSYALFWALSLPHTLPSPNGTGQKLATQPCVTAKHQRPGKSLTSSRSGLPT